MSDEGTGTGGTGGESWYSGFGNADVKTWVAAVEGASPESIAQKAFNLEKFLGADKANRGVVWPKDDTDTEGWNGIYARMGRPEKPEGYELPIPENDPGDFAKAFAPVLHEAGLSKRQAQLLATKLNEYQAGLNTRANESIERAFKDDQAMLAREWGAAAGQKAELAKRAAAAAGLTEDDIADMVASLGYAKTQRMLATYGERMGEDKFVGSDGKPANAALTPEGAKARMSQLALDTDWQKRLANGDLQAQREKDELDAAMLGISLDDLRAQMQAGGRRMTGT